MNPIRRALVSVTDKTDLVDFCRVLSDEFGVELVSTGGTARTLAEAGVPVRPIEDFTGAPEMLDGRVKTLNPKVHGALLALRDNPEHQATVAEQGIELIDLVCVNLYAFEETIAKPGVTEADAVEHIDIGGPSMLRSAAKNFAAVTVVSSPDQYDQVLAEMRDNAGATLPETRRAFAQRVFATTSAYDRAITDYLAGGEVSGSGGGDALSAERPENEPVASFSAEQSASPAPPAEPALDLSAPELTLHLNKRQDLRYGENPHQQAAFYARDDAQPGSIAAAEQLNGKELSYNNILDTDAAWAAVREFAEPACAIIKHANPCGLATHDDLVKAYQAAWEGDPVSAYGGIVAFNRPVTAEVVEAIFANKQFVEVLVAPNYTDAALELLHTKKNMRVLATGAVPPPGGDVELRATSGGMLVQELDTVNEDPATFTVPTRRQPTEAERRELLFAWKVCKSVKSNAIVICRDEALLGLGAGQPNRVDSARIAVGHAGEAARGAVAASDAFMPFADSLEALAEAGVTAVIQPGGSIRDDEVIAAADAADIALLFTGHRHFRH
ncbi:MAG: bifunctional phosphoribosylaminoimidazolecarboxamide formyltransferase/IMP cyclohydrolase [Coriobacteriia bacterium]|nr:bifunctional phosphoribosylaminoimidazolecarboxamide formyltransferase/IMP cyclohydrolase [Coriobacteriia bacterium]